MREFKPVVTKQSLRRRHPDPILDDLDWKMEAVGNNWRGQPVKLDQSQRAALRR